jgi:mannose-6-phosphate isomerase-like protein (cupin superfamily)
VAPLRPAEQGALSAAQGRPEVNGAGSNDPNEPKQTCAPSSQVPVSSDRPPSLLKGRDFRRAVFLSLAGVYASAFVVMGESHQKNRNVGRCERSSRNHRHFFGDRTVARGAEDVHAAGYQMVAGATFTSGRGGGGAALWRRHQRGAVCAAHKGTEGLSRAAATHPKSEIATVLSGAVRLGMGDKDHIFPAGSFYAAPPGMVHQFAADEDTVVQVNSTGPWGINYLNPKEDPRQKSP